MKLEKRLEMEVILKEDKGVQMAKVEDRSPNEVVVDETSVRLRMKPNKMMPNRQR